MSHLAPLLPTWPATPPAAASPAATPSVAAVFDSLQQVRHFHDAAISLDGRRVAWSVKGREGAGPARLGSVVLSDLPAGGTPRRLTASTDGKTHRELDAVFSP